mgnify:CR=1 FL=1
MKRLSFSKFSLCILCASVSLWFGCRHAASSQSTNRPLTPKAAQIVAGAKAEAERAPTYDANYYRMAYPMGDVPKERGACTDVVVRALRTAKIDLQQKIHEDMKQNFAVYPKRYRLKKPDSNIDHRRTANHLVFLKRHAKSLPLGTTGKDAATWQPGDLVYWKLPSGLGHCGVLSDRTNAVGLPRVIHNLSRAQEEDCLTAWQITGHFRYPKG